MTLGSAGAFLPQSLTHDPYPAPCSPIFAQNSESLEHLNAYSQMRSVIFLGAGGMYICSADGFLAQVLEWKRLGKSFSRHTSRITAAGVFHYWETFQSMSPCEEPVSRQMRDMVVSSVSGENPSLRVVSPAGWER
jgi:hypothetical protein